MSAKVTQIGGIRADGFRATWPFVSFEARREKLVLSLFSKRYEIEKDKIVALKRYKGVFFEGLKIEHSKYEIPQQLIFWTFSFDRLKDDLEKIGYKVES